MLDLSRLPEPPTDICDVTYEQIGEGVAGTTDTINAMISESLRGSLDFFVINSARSIIMSNRLDARDYESVADCYFRFIRNEITYIHDPYWAELLQSPRRTLQLRAGDCDDQAVLFAALCLSVGIKARFVTIAVDDPRYYSHVYPQAWVGTQWKTYDTIVNHPAGWEAPSPLSKRVWYIAPRQSGQVALAGFFDDVADWFKKIWKKIKAEIERFTKRILDEVSRVARKLRELKRKVFEKIQAEFARWEAKYGMLGKVLVVGVKALLYAVPYVGQALFVAAQVFDNPFRLTKDEWMLLIQIGATIASALITIVTGGAASGLLAATALSLISTAASAVQVADQIDQRKELLKQLKEAKTKWAEEERVRRQAMAKLQHDIIVLEQIGARMDEHVEKVRAIKQANEIEVSAIKLQIEQEMTEKIAEYRKQRHESYLAFCAGVESTDEDMQELQGLREMYTTQLAETRALIERAKRVSA